MLRSNWLCRNTTRLVASRGLIKMRKRGSQRPKARNEPTRADLVSIRDQKFSRPLIAAKEARQKMKSRRNLAERERNHAAAWNYKRLVRQPCTIFDEIGKQLARNEAWSVCSVISGPAHDRRSAWSVARDHAVNLCE